MEVRKRPVGLTVLAILWFLGGLYNLYQGSQAISLDLEVLPLLNSPNMPEWFKFGVPAELAISLFVFVLGLLQIFATYGLWTGKPWSYKLALAVPILNAVSWLSVAVLYASAPIEFEIADPFDWVSAFFSIFWAIIFLSYLRQSHVKEYLKVKQVEAVKCPFCGFEIKQGFTFCANCGKNIASAPAYAPPPPSTPDQPQRARRVCPYCGSPFKLEDRFCGNCGAKLQ